MRLPERSEFRLKPSDASGKISPMTQEPSWLQSLQLDGKGSYVEPPLNYDPSSPTGEDTVWYHGDYKDPDVQAWVREKLKLSPLLTEALMDENPKPRCLVSDQGMLIVLRGVNLNPKSDPEDMVALRVWIQKGLILSLRHRKVIAVQSLHKKLEHGEGPKNTHEWLSQLITIILKLTLDVIDQVDEEVDQLEEFLLVEKDKSSCPMDMADVRRSIIRLRRHLAPQRDLFIHLQNELPAWLPPDFRNSLKEFVNITARLVEDLESARDRAAITHEAWNHQTTERMNRTIYMLSIVTAIFLPLGLITGLLGVNIGGMPGTESRYAFWDLCGFLVLIGLLEWWLLRRNRWL